MTLMHQMVSEMMYESIFLALCLKADLADATAYEQIDARG